MTINGDIRLLRRLDTTTNSVYCDISELMQLQDVIDPLYDSLFRPIAQVVVENTGDKIHDSLLEIIKR